MTRFVIRHAFLLGGARITIFLFQTEDDTIDSFVDVVHLDLFALMPRCKKFGFVDDVGEVRPSHSWCSSGDSAELCIRSEFDLLGMELQDGLAAVDVRPIHDDLSIKPSGA